MPPLGGMYATGRWNSTGAWGTCAAPRTEDPVVMPPLSDMAHRPFALTYPGVLSEEARDSLRAAMTSYHRLDEP